MQFQWIARWSGALTAALVMALMAMSARPATATDWTLVMVEQQGCAYCIRWTDEIGPEYPLTPEGRFAPLRRVDLRDLPDDLIFSSRLVYTPTFVLMRDTTEIGRIEGYPGEDFFWGVLGRLLSQGDAAWGTQGDGG